jgi:hypothetical protein
MRPTAADLRPGLLLPSPGPSRRRRSIAPCVRGLRRLQPGTLPVAIVRKKPHDRPAHALTVLLLLCNVVAGIGCRVTNSVIRAFSVHLTSVQGCAFDFSSRGRLALPCAMRDAHARGALPLRRRRNLQCAPDFLARSAETAADEDNAPCEVADKRKRDPCWSAFDEKPSTRQICDPAAPLTVQWGLSRTLLGRGGRRGPGGCGRGPGGCGRGPGGGSGNGSGSGR